VLWVLFLTALLLSALIHIHQQSIPMQVKKQVDVIAQTLSQEDTANADKYSSNAEKFKK
jgi:cell division protein FtsL